MRYLTTFLGLAALGAGCAVPVLADTLPNAGLRHNGPGMARMESRSAPPVERRDDWQTTQDQRRSDWRDSRDERRDDWRDARDRMNWERDRYRREGDRWDRDRWDYRRDDGRYGYNNYWTPYGFGYPDALTQRWAFYHFDDNRNGSLSKKEWKRAQKEFYRFADRNRDGYIDRREYAWVQSYMHGDYRRSW